MKLRIRQCAECPKCLTRYPIAASPYGNGSYLVPAVPFLAEEYTLYCTCGKPAVATWCKKSEFQTFKVTAAAHQRGYGTPEEIMPTRGKSRGSLSASGSVARTHMRIVELMGGGNDAWIEDLLR